MISLILALQVFPPVQAPAIAPPKPQMAKCTGVNERDELQSLILESRYIKSEGRTALFVVKDSSGLLKSGDWLENQHNIFKDGDRKRGIDTTWDDQSFSKHVGNHYARIRFIVTGESSAAILYVSRIYSDREKTASRYLDGGTIVLTGHCTLFYDGNLKTFKNSPPFMRTE